MPAVTLVSCRAANWIGVYVDGEITVQGPEGSVTPADVLDAIDAEYEEQRADPRWFDERGELPADLDDVRLADD